MLLSALIEPIPRTIFETVIRCKCVELLIDALKQRQHQRKDRDCSSGSLSYGIIEPLKQVFRRLFSDGMNLDCEDQILSMKDYLVKLHKAKCRSEMHVLVKFSQLKKYSEILTAFQARRKAKMQ